MYKYLPSIVLLSLLAGTYSANAQSGVVAGDATGLTHYILQPELKIEAGSWGSVEVPRRDSLDLDHDGHFDIVFLVTAYLQVGKHPWFRCNPGPTGPNVEILKKSDGQYAFAAVVALAAGQPIGDTDEPFIADPSSVTPTWAPIPAGRSQPVFLFHANNPGGHQYGGDWFDSLPHYMAFRLRQGAGWRYGWLKLQISMAVATAGNHIFRVTEYALQPAAVLATKTSVSGVAGLYPNPAHNALQVPGAMSGRLTIFDAVGKSVLSQDITPMPAQSVSIEALPVGSYFIEIRSAKGDIRRGRFEKI